MQLGRRQSRSLLTPSNQGMARRADKRLDSTVNSAAARFETALAVDGVFCVVWNRTSGSRSCSCQESTSSSASFSGFQPTIMDSSKVSTNVVINADGEEQTVRTSGASVSVDVLHDDLYQYVGENLTRDGLDGYFQGRTVNETTRQRINPDEGDFYQDFTDETGDAPVGGDLLEALSEDGIYADFDADDDPLIDVVNPYGALPTDSTTGQGDNMLNSVTLACPVCVGTGRVDAWQPFNGTRQVLDITHPGIEIGDASFSDDTQPQVLEIPQNGTVSWNNVILPIAWEHSMALRVFHEGVLLVDGRDYTLEYELVTATGTWLPLTMNTLSSLRKNATSVYHLNIRLTANRLLMFTHVLIVLADGFLPKIQVPELNIPNNSEFIDWELNVQFEVSSKVELRENSYINEAKYGRLWKISAVNRKISAAGKSFGYQVDARAIHSFEKAALALKMFGEYIDPFSMGVDEEMDDEL